MSKFIVQDGNNQRAAAKVRLMVSVSNEMEAQDEQWGVRDLPFGPGDFSDLHFLNEGRARETLEGLMKAGEDTWSHILAGEVGKALVEEDPEQLIAELTQIMAVCGQAVLNIQRKLKESEDA